MIEAITGFVGGLLGGGSSSSAAEQQFQEKLAESIATGGVVVGSKLMTQMLQKDQDSIPN